LADVVELVDTLFEGAVSESCAGSSPAIGTNYEILFSKSSDISRYEFFVKKTPKILLKDCHKYPSD
tara:strand:+ start:459 stop:656 length:198 start_codon:yes stop_codon:yes gene_type:complete